MEPMNHPFFPPGVHLVAPFKLEHSHDAEGQEVLDFTYRVIWSTVLTRGDHITHRVHLGTKSSKILLGLTLWPLGINIPARKRTPKAVSNALQEAWASGHLITWVFAFEWSTQPGMIEWKMVGPGTRNRGVRWLSGYGVPREEWPRMMDRVDRTLDLADVARSIPHPPAPVPMVTAPAPVRPKTPDPVPMSTEHLGLRTLN